MKYYLLKNSKDIYSILQNGIKSESVAYSIGEISEAFESMKKEYVPCILEVQASSVTSFSKFALSKSSSQDIKVVNPKDVGIDDPASNIAYNLYSANNKFIKSKIENVALSLTSDNKDLADYLKLTSKLSFDEDNNIEKFAQEMLNVNDDKISKSDLADSFEHASALFDEELSVDDYDYEYYEDFPVGDLYVYDDIDAWAEWKAGELAELDEKELEEEVQDFRPKALDWVKTGKIPPIIVIDSDEGSVIGDGRGRVSIALGMGFRTIPVIVATQKNKTANSFDRMIKLASVLDLGDPDLAGKSLADIVLFLLRRIPSGERPKAISSMIAKVRNINSQEVAGKNMGDYSSMGQSLTFIKNVLSGHDEGYVRRVLDSIIRNMS